MLSQFLQLQVHKNAHNATTVQSHVFVDEKLKQSFENYQVEYNKVKAQYDKDLATYESWSKKQQEDLSDWELSHLSMPKNLLDELQVSMQAQVAKDFDNQIQALVPQIDANNNEAKKVFRELSGHESSWSDVKDELWAFSNKLAGSINTEVKYFMDSHPETMKFVTTGALMLGAGTISGAVATTAGLGTYAALSTETGHQFLDNSVNRTLDALGVDDDARFNLIPFLSEVTKMSLSGGAAKLGSKGVVGARYVAGKYDLQTPMTFSWERFSKGLNSSGSTLNSFPGEIPQVFLDAVDLRKPLVKKSHTGVPNKPHAQAISDGQRLKIDYYLKDKKFGPVDKNGNQYPLLNLDGTLSEFAISKSDIAVGGPLANPEVVQHLTRDGSKITDWTKMKTPKAQLPNGQPIEVHFYQHKSSGKIDYIHPDFKSKGVAEFVSGEATAIDPVNVRLDPRNTHYQQTNRPEPAKLEDYSKQIYKEARAQHRELQKTHKEMSSTSNDYQKNLETPLKKHEVVKNKSRKCSPSPGKS